MKSTTTSGKTSDYYGFVFYPNPRNGIFNVKLNSSENVKSIVVTNMKGQRIIYKTTVSSSDTDINLHRQPAGIYLFKVKFLNDEVIKKLVKQ